MRWHWGREQRGCAGQWGVPCSSSEALRFREGVGDSGDRGLRPGSLSNGTYMSGSPGVLERH